MKTYIRALRYASPYSWHFFWAILLVGVFTASNIFFLPLTRDLITQFSNKQILNISNQVLNAIVLYGIRMLAQNGQLYIMSSLSMLITIDIRMDLYRKLQELPQAFYAERKLGDLLSRLFNDVDRIKDALIQGLSDLLPQICTFVGVITYMFFMNWKLTAFSCITVPVFIGIISYAAQHLKKNTHQLQQKIADINHVAQETLGNLKSVQACTMEEYEITRFKKENIKSYHTTMKGIGVRLKSEPLVSFLQFAVIGLVVWYGGYEISQGRMTGADLASFFTGIMLLIDPVLAISKIYNNLQQGLASAERVYDIMDIPSTITSPPDAITSHDFRGEVVFDQVGFWYSSPDKPALKDISFSVNPGEVVALVGHSGAGKTTLIHLLPRFYDSTTGSITVDGIPVTQFNLQFLRSHIGIVPQEDVLFRGSVLENVRYGAQHASDEEVMDALKLANAWEFVSQMPGGIFSKIGDRGRKLSGGQKQRLSIARALLKNPKILILDEATSALDSHSEKLVQEALDRLMSNRTTFVIAHRLSTIMHASQILVMEHGQIKEVGQHSELLLQGGLYSKLYHLQFEKQLEQSS